MLKFLIQTINNKVVHDFAFELERSIEYHKWREEEMFAAYCSFEQLETMDFGVDSDEIRDYVPIGTVEFVIRFCELFINENAKQIIKPINVPEELFPFAGRKIQNIEVSKENVNIEKCYIKSNDIIKFSFNGFTNVFYNPPLGNYQVSEEVMNMYSEYRCFVYKDELDGIQWYRGDFTLFPNVDDINKMLEHYKWNYGNGPAPEAFTLDVWVAPNGRTYVLEVHEFFSCGLYGYSNYHRLPYMFKRVFNNIKNRLNSKIK